MLKRRGVGEPTAYLLGYREFMGMRFRVDRRVLIPRPETEILVQAALESLDAPERSLAHEVFEPFEPSDAPEVLNAPAPSRPCRESVGAAEPAGPLVADIGCGSGAIGLSIAVLRRNASVVLTDISPEALEVAVANAADLGLLDRGGASGGLRSWGGRESVLGTGAGVDGDVEAGVDACTDAGKQGEGRVRFLCGDLVKPLLEAGYDRRFDLVVSNPPYIPSEEMGNLPPEVRLFEPRAALDGGPEGLRFIRRLAREAAPLLRYGGRILLEIGDGQADSCRHEFEKVGVWQDFEVILDYSGRKRVFSAKVRGLEGMA